MQGDKLLDEIGRQILKALQENARISFSELGRRVGLSSPAVAERVHRMEEAGYIKGYMAVVDQEKLGFPIMAFIRVTASVGKLKEADDMARTIPEVVEGHHLTGTDGFILKVVVSSVRHLEEIINQMGNYGQTTTSIVLSSPVSSRVLTPFFPATIA
ncbi:MAG: Lrp/AsnC family transcriptional regulator [Synergistaceae bacterium]|jgi:Lrp/AsnC family leucine-responsive transcriptional regulator|nr:Lrp/AsnC family transcriptional regulator [Synergistaceae bacterium]